MALFIKILAIIIALCFWAVLFLVGGSLLTLSKAVDGSLQFLYIICVVGAISTSLVIYLLLPFHFTYPEEETDTELNDDKQ